MNSQTKVCQNCHNEFWVEPDDFSFYEKIVTLYLIPAILKILFTPGELKIAGERWMLITTPSWKIVTKPSIARNQAGCCSAKMWPAALIQLFCWIAGIANIALAA